MNSNWNVYKVFKNGKRAKAPIHEFNFIGSTSEAINYFNDYEVKTLIEKFGDKLSNSKFQILNSNDLQERTTEASVEEKFSKEKNRVLGQIMRQKGFETKKKYSTGLIMSSDSDWKWQWAVLEVATNRYVEGLSDKFKSYEEAYNWMTDLINSTLSEK